MATYLVVGGNRHRQRQTVPHGRRVMDDEQAVCDRRTQPVWPVPEPPEMVAGTGVEPANPAL
jgi:hypothetical protein